jgi:hypothetical protein
VHGVHTGAESHLPFGDAKIVRAPVVDHKLAGDRQTRAIVRTEHESSHHLPIEMETRVPPGREAVGWDCGQGRGVSPVEEDIRVVADDRLAGQLRAGIVGSSPYGAG